MELRTPVAHRPDFFRSLGTIPGSFTLELAGAIGAVLDPALDAETLEACLRQLHLHNLLGWEQDAAGERRFVMLNTIRVRGLEAGALPDYRHISSRPYAAIATILS
jgi:hypothetical protein